MNSTSLLQLHIPQSTPSLDVPSSVPSSSPFSLPPSLSLPTHLSQLQSPSRHELVQGEMMGMYLIVPPSLLEKHRWLALPWGPKLQRLEREKRYARRSASAASASRQREEEADNQEEEFDEKKEEEKQKTEDEAVLQRLQPCPLHLRLALRVVPESEVSQYAPEFSSSLKLSVNGLNEDEDDGGDIVHESSSSDSDDSSSSDTDSSTDTDSTSEEDTTGERESKRKAAATSRSYSVSVVTSPSNALASTRSPSNSTTSASASSARLAFRKSTLPTAFPSSSSHHHRPHKHHPSKLAPGYAPPSARGAAKQEQVSAWSHAQNDLHTMPAVGKHDVTAPPSVYYFYTNQLPPPQPMDTHPLSPNPDFAVAESPNAAASSSSSTATSSTAAAFPYGSLVLFIETSISILPSFLSSCNRMDAAHVLAMEVDLLAPAAKHHAFLRDCTVALPNTDAFLLEGAMPGAGLDSSVKYWSLRGFVSKNRALQVPHSIPPVKYYLTVYDPIHLSCKAINLSNGSNRESEDVEGDPANSNQQALSMGGDVALEFIVRNVSHEWSVDVHRFDFMLDRTRMFLKIVSSAIESAPSPRSTKSPASPSSSRAASPASPSTKSHQKTGGATTSVTTIVKEQRSIHSIPLGSYFELQADESSLPAVLAPLEELHLLAFLSAPQGTKLSQLESLIRDCLHASGSQSAGSFSFLAAGAALPFRTPWSVSYSVQDVGKQGTSQICSQNKIMWKSRCYAHSQMQSSPSTAPAGALPLRIKESGNKSLSAPSQPPHHRKQLSSGAAGVQSPQQSPHTPLTNALSQLKLSLRLKMPSPVPLHGLFPVFISVTNHSSTPTPHLQVVILPPSHPLVAKSIEMQREDEQKLTHRRQTGAEEFTSPMSMHDSSIDISLNPVPQYLYHPSTPFSSNTPFMIDQFSSPTYSSGSESYGRQFNFPSIEAQLTSRRPAGWPSLMNSAEDSPSPPPPPPMRHLSSTGSEDVLTSSVSQFLSEATTNGTGPRSTRNKVQPLLHELQREQEFTAKQGSEASLSSLICMETSVSVGTLPAYATQSGTLHYVALREGLLPLSNQLFLYEQVSGTYWRPSSACSVFARRNA